MIKFLYTCFLLLLICHASIQCKHTVKANVSNQLPSSVKYELVKNWPRLPSGLLLSQVTGIGVNSQQHILLFHRAGRQWKEPFVDSLISINTILELERETGAVLHSWGANLFVIPHGLTVDKHDNVWVTDVALQQIFKFNREGKLLLKLGEYRVEGNDSLHFNRPTDVAVCHDGSFYVSDGYGNNRVVKFSAEGHFLFEWGSSGTDPGEFDLPHSIDLDKKENVYVADRENKRVQQFDSNGHFLKEWKDPSMKKLYAVVIDKTSQQLMAVDYFSVFDLFTKGSDIIGFENSGPVSLRFGRSGFYDGPISRYHDIATDIDGNIYVGDILNNTIQKFRIISNK
ncbi:MAG: peptidyl-alpha-hydroxyglycine alpha-amidating lyase family protein [Bacteroidota bacterium]